MAGLMQQVSGALTTLLLYAMLGVPFAVWSARASQASARAVVDGRMRGRPGRVATVFLVVLPSILVLYTLVSGVSAVQTEAVDLGAGTAQARVPDSEWGAYAFLAVSPACGMIVGFLLGWIWARNGGNGQEEGGE